MPYSEISISRDETIDERLERVNSELRGASAQTILRASIVREWAGELCYVSSFGAESAVMLALIADIDPGLPVIFLQTGMHFPQTLDYKETLVEKLGLTNIQDISPSENDRLASDPKNNLWRSDPDACCDIRKVRPLDDALAGFGAWITGRKRFHGGARLNLKAFEYSAGRFKINPMASWTQEDVQIYSQHRQLPRHPLVDQGFPSIGCWPCTKPAENPNDVRSGRWVGQEKTECGLHVEKAERPRVF
ncbi:MAG: phosphoadenylyl-sulfate reductase [Henriciella sp.]